jgi:calcineurin-like phosphoesterase family protein
MIVSGVLGKGLPEGSQGELMAIWFTADYHIGHWNILTLGKGRPFSSLDEMHAAIADRHNAVVRPGDLVYFLGDLALKIKWDEAMRFRKRLTGNFYYILGNHDSVAKEMFRHDPTCFVWMHDLETIKPKIDGIPPITLCHYAMRTWPGSHKGSWQIYGHSHSNLPEDHSLSFDIGVDAWDFAPVSIEQVKAKMQKKMPAWEAYKESLKDTGRAE